MSAGKVYFRMSVYGQVGVVTSCSVYSDFYRKKVCDFSASVDVKFRTVHTLDSHVG